MKNQVENIRYNVVKSGELQGSATVLQMPDISCRAVAFSAVSDNAGSVYIGGAGVTAPDGTTDTTSGLELQAGDMTQFIPVPNLNVFYRICANAGDDLTYMVLE
jgi:hypothetical protein